MNWQYLKYVVRHKWYVFVECMRRGLWWRAITHDLSKLRPSEWSPYARSFYGPKYPKLYDTHGAEREAILSSGLWKERVRARFDFAWLLHQKRNDHHWQWWLLTNDSDGAYPLPMSEAARTEMLCDWIGAGKAQGHPDTKEWYLRNKNNMVLHEDDRSWIEGQLG